MMYNGGFCDSILIPPLQYVSGLVFQRHLLCAQPSVCLHVTVSAYMCAHKGTRLSLIAAGPSADARKQA